MDTDVAAVLAGTARAAVVHGDGFEVIGGLPDASVDAIITDPPYASVSAAASYVTSSVPKETQFFEAWMREHVVAWMRVLKPTGAIWMTLDWRGAVTLDSAASRLGLRAPSIGVWHRGGLGMGSLLRHSFECFAILVKEGFERRNAGEPDVWVHPWSAAHRKFGHSAEKPVELMRRAIRFTTDPGMIVVDPFCGSGTTGAAAVIEDRRFIGIEREAEFVATSRKRVECARPLPVNRYG